MITAPDLQALVRKLYVAEGVDRTKATLAERHAVQRLYTINRTLAGYSAKKK